MLYTNESLGGFSIYVLRTEDYVSLAAIVNKLVS